MAQVKIHFPLLHPEEMPIDLARALGVGGFGPAQWAAGPDENKYQQLNEQASQYFTVVPLDEAQVIVYPHKVRDSPEVRQVSLEAQRRGLPCLFFGWGDEDQPIDLPHGIVYRHSLYSDRRRPCERACPAFCADVLESAVMAPRERREKPSVGFCGFTSNPLMRALYRVMRRRRKAVGLELRAKVLRVLRRCPRVQTHFIGRHSYWAGTAGRYHRNTAGQYPAREQFLRNVEESDYTLCVRGAGNFSYRFYEVLSAGRIPLLINTHCVLPFEEEIDWRQHCVWVEEEQIEQAGEMLAEFHAKLTPERFVEMQQANRRLWEQSFSPLGFYRQAIARATGLAKTGA